jgi:general secretion pathway protein C
MRSFKIEGGVLVALVSALSAYLISTVIFISLPKSGFNREPVAPFRVSDSYRIADMFIVDKRIVKQKPKPKPKKVEKVYDLKKWKLQAVYISPSESFILLVDKKNNEIISLMEEYKGYKLVDVKTEEAIFERAGKSYSLKLEDSKKKGKSTPLSSPDVPPPPVDIENKVDPETNEISSASVKRKDIEFFMNNVSQIWRNIKIKPYRENRSLKGFKVTWVKRGSAFEALGLQRGDIISAIDGSPIKSFKQIQRYYKNIKKIKNLNLTVLRNGEEKEIDYEIQ